MLIGGSAAGVGETFVTPFDEYLPGIEWRATVIDDILRQDFMVRRGDTVLLDLGFLVVGGLAIGWLAQRGRLLGPSVGLAALVAALLAINLWAFARGFWLDLFAPIVALVALYATVMLYKYFIGERQERRLRAAFKHYLSPALVEQVARDPRLLQLGGEQKELTYFSPIRAIRPALGPSCRRQNSRLINEVMETITDVLFAHDGMLDKFTATAWWRCSARRCPSRITRSAPAGPRSPWWAISRRCRRDGRAPTCRRSTSASASTPAG